MEKEKEMSKKSCWFFIATLPMFTPRTVKEMLSAFGSPEAFYAADRQKIVGFVQERMKERGNTPLAASAAERIIAMIEERKQANIVHEYNKVEERGIQFITIEDNNYPNKLKQCYDAPYWLFLRGSLPNENAPSVAVIGARQCSIFGRELAKKLSAALAKAGIQVISGMAEGIDGAAHQGAFLAGTATYAVLGSGIDVCYPQEHKWMYQKMLLQGGIISEYSPGTKGLSFHFPMRNRIIAGLSDGILVIEARERSGTLITVDRGLEQGKDIYAVPGHPGETLSAGCNRLIQSGAKLITCAEDIIEELETKYELYFKELVKKTNATGGGSSKGNEIKFLNNLLDQEEKIVYANLSLVPKHVEQICADTRISAELLYQALVSLELKGYIKQAVKNYYIRNF